MSAMVIREATTQDYKGVLDLGAFYDGIDYIPYLYHQFLNDPHYLCYVCEVDGKVVGYTCGLIHDSGRMLQGRTLRVMSEYRGKGYGTGLSKRLMNDAANKSKELTFIKFEVNWGNVGQTVEHIDTMKSVYFTIPQPENYVQPSSLIRLDEERFGSILDSPAACHTLYSHGLMYVHFLALGLDKSNIRHIINEDTSVFVKLATGSDSSPNDFLPENIRSLSVSIRYPSPIGLICDITFHGTYLEDLGDHVSAQLSEITQRDKITVGLYAPIVCPVEIFENKASEICSKFCGKTGTIMENQCLLYYVFRKPLKPSSKY